MINKCMRVAMGLSLLLSFVLQAGCSQSTAGAQSTFSTMEIAAAMIKGQEGVPPMQAIVWNDEGLADYLSGYYNIDDSLLEDAVVSYAGGVEASEISVLLFTKADDASAAKGLLEDYITSRANVFIGYAPQQAAIVEKGRVIVNGRYAALLICPDPDAAETAFLECFKDNNTPPDVQAVFAPLEQAMSEQPVPEQAPYITEAGDASATPAAATGTPAETTPIPDETDLPTLQLADPDEYDGALVVAAWQSGDASALAGKNLEVYNAAVAVIDLFITEDMKDYEKELAIHDYITANCSFDLDSFDRDSDNALSPDSETPYGMLINGKGFCAGYSTTFQLFMDMLDIECITVTGASGDLEHEWNMVRLGNGEWYCVDVTWDDPSDEPAHHDYFNVNSKYMLATHHQWDESAVPEATDHTHSYRE